MAVKKSPARKPAKHTTHSEPQVDHIPDVFDEEGDSSSVVPQQRSVRSPLVVEVEDITVDVAPRQETEVNEDSDLPTPTAPPAKEDVSDELPLDEEVMTAPTFTVRANGQDVEQKLPSFFVESAKGGEETVAKNISQEDQPSSPELVSVPETTDMSAFEALVPQAFVGEVREVAHEVKQEKKGALVTFFIIIGMILVALGIVGLYFMSTKKSDSTPTPTPTPIVEATPVPTPTIIINTATGSAQITPVDATVPKPKLKVNVLNGTPTKGLAAKEAAELKKAGYTIGDVGNGSPALAGTITVPTGSSDIATGIQSALTGFTFTVKEDPKATAITVVLGDQAQ